jgi:ribosomal protein S18 acetylase RimI-like enzyme
MVRSKTGWTLRAARADEAEAIATLHTTSWRRTYRGMMSDAFLDGAALDDRRGVWRQRLGAANASQFICVADLNASIVGFICAFAGADPLWGSYIDNLHVAPDLHRSGVGRALMRRTGEWLCEVLPQAGVYLWVMEANTSARAFYHRLGARNVETVEKDDPGGSHAPNCRYVWANPRMLIDTQSG